MAFRATLLFCLSITAGLLPLFRQSAVAQVNAEAWSMKPLCKPTCLVHIACMPLVSDAQITWLCTTLYIPLVLQCLAIRQVLKMYGCLGIKLDKASKRIWPVSLCHSTPACSYLNSYRDYTWAFSFIWAICISRCNWKSNWVIAITYGANYNYNYFCPGKFNYNYNCNYMGRCN